MERECISDRARYYSPTLQRFIGEDPIGFAGGFNLYRYVSDNPVNRVDPLGMWQLTLSGGAGWGARITIGNNGGSGFFNGQWNFGFYGGGGEGLALDIDIYNRGCHQQGLNWGVEGNGEIGFGPEVEAEAHVGTDPWWNINGNIPGTPVGGSIGTEGVTVPTIGFGESVVVGVGGTAYF